MRNKVADTIKQWLLSAMIASPMLALIIFAKLYDGWLRWLAMALAFTILIVLIVIGIRHEQRAWEFLLSDDHACENCGYDLTGNTTATCPECGTPLDDAAGEDAQ